MGIKEQIGEMLAKRKEEKARENQMIADAKLQDKIEFKKLTPEESQLAHHAKIEKMKKDRITLKKIWHQKEKQVTESNKVNSKLAFKDEQKLMTGKSVFAPHKSDNKILFKDRNVFTGKNVFASKNIFVAHKGAGLR